MTVIKINAITVPEDSGSELGKRFAARQSSMEGTPGFEGFELFEPTDGRTQWLVVTRWESEEAFQQWTDSQDFKKAHGSTSGSGHGHTAHDASDGAAGRDAAAPQGSDHDRQSAEESPRKPVGVSAELWSYRVSVTG